MIFDILQTQNIRVDCFCDDNLASSDFCGLPVIRRDNLSTGTAIVSIGKNSVRKEVVAYLKGRDGIVFGRAIHPSAVISSSSEIGLGTVVMPGVLVNAGAVVGEHCILNTGSSIDHDCRIGDFVHVSPHATLCGNVSVGEASWVGAGSVVIQGISIGKNCLIGAGSVVTRDLPDNVLAYGNPCRIMKLLPPPPHTPESRDS